MASLENRTQPSRKCTGCGEHFPKSSLVRVLRTPDGNIVLDKTGKLSGRGAYVCKNSDCLKKAIKSSRIERSLECKIPEDIYEKLKTEIESK